MSRNYLSQSQGLRDSWYWVNVAVGCMWFLLVITPTSTKVSKNLKEILEGRVWPSRKLNFLVKLQQAKNVTGASNRSRLTAKDVVSI